MTEESSRDTVERTFRDLANELEVAYVVMVAKGRNYLEGDGWEMFRLGGAIHIQVSIEAQRSTETLDVGHHDRRTEARMADPEFRDAYEAQRSTETPGSGS